MKKINCRDKSVLIIGDLHAPYHHPDTLKWLAAIKKKYLDKDSVIISIGDEVDHHAISFHDSDSALFNADKELEKACEFLQELESLFPAMHILDSNHGSLVFRRLKKHGVPLTVLKPLHEVYGVSEKWRWHDELILSTLRGQTYLCHGRSANAEKLVGAMGMSCIQGHYHGNHSLTWYCNGVESKYHGFTGCLVDEKSLAFSYGRLSTKKPILGSILIRKSGTPLLLTMSLNKRRRWDKKLDC